MERLLYKHIQNDVSWSCGLASSGVYPAQVMLTHNALRRVHGRVVGTVFFSIRLTQDPPASRGHRASQVGGGPSGIHYGPLDEGERRPQGGLFPVYISAERPASHGTSREAAPRWGVGQENN